MSEPLRWASLLQSSIIDFNRLAPPLQDALFESKLRRVSNVIFFCTGIYKQYIFLSIHRMHFKIPEIFRFFGIFSILLD